MKSMCFTMENILHILERSLICTEKIPPYKSTDKIDLWYNGDSYTAWLIEYEQNLGLRPDNIGLATCQ
mgnify:CR=1 FL=1